MKGASQYGADAYQEAGEIYGHTATTAMKWYSAQLPWPKIEPKAEPSVQSNGVQPMNGVEVAKAKPKPKKTQQVEDGSPRPKKRKAASELISLSKKLRVLEQNLEAVQDSLLMFKD